MHEYVKKQSDGKRILAGFLDIIFALFLSVLLFLPVEAISGAFGYGFYNNYKTELYATLVYSELYELNEETNLVEAVTGEDKLPRALYKFYVDKSHPTTNELQRGFSPILDPQKKDVPNSFNTAEDYYVFVLGKNESTTLFDFTTISEEAPWNVAAKQGNELLAKTFYEEAYVHAHYEFGLHPRVIYLIRKTDTIDFVKYAITFLMASALLVIVLPLFLDNNVTLGKKLTKTAYVDESGFKITRKRGLLRNSAMFIFSYVFFFMPFHLISLILSIFTKNKRSLYDFFAATTVVTTEGSLFFKDEEELKVYRKKLAQILLAQNARKQKLANEND